MTEARPVMSDLVERLLKKDAWTNHRPYWHHRNPDGPEAAARITELETALAEAEGRVIADVVAWLRDENGQCDCFARSEGECACGAWDDYKTKPLLDIATALETGEWKK